MRSVFILAGLAVLGTIVIVIAGIWLAEKEKENGLGALEGTSVDVATLPQTVPFTTVAGHIVVDATLGGSDEVVPLILDSGAPVILSDAIAERFGGPSAGSMQTAAIDGSVISSEVVLVSELRLGDAIFRDAGAVKGFVDDDNPLSCISRNGLIGASLMKEAVWQIDYDRGEVTIAASTDGLDHIDGALQLGFSSPTTTSPSPRIVLGAGDDALSVLIDTGSDGGLTVNPGDLEAVGVEIETDGPAYDVVAAGAAGSYDARVIYSPVDLALTAEVTLHDYPVATIDSLQLRQGNVGNGFLDDFVVTIDWPNSVLYLDPISPEPGPSVPQAVSLSWDGERVMVGSLVGGSAPAAAGLALSQPIASIDGLDVSGATRDEFCELSATYASGTFEISTDDGATYLIDAVSDFFDRQASPPQG